MLDRRTYSALKPNAVSYVITLLALVVLIVVGGYCAWLMEHSGHRITGMNNHVVWGTPHVFAIFLIVAASGALNIASMSTVFGVTLYKPFARISIALAIALLIGGLLVLVLDLGRPDRLIIAMTTWNFRSVFAWNIIFYTGFIAIGIAYLCCLMERRYNRYSRGIGSLALLWRVALTTATGSIFGFLVGRNALDSAVLAPMFIAMSLAFGTAVFVLTGAAVSRWSNYSWTLELRRSLAKFVCWFVLAMGYFTIIHHLTNLYASEHRVMEYAFLTGSLSILFWAGHVLIGLVLPVVLIWRYRDSDSATYLVGAAFAVIVGGLCHVYTIVIGSQFTPQRIFPDKIVIDSRFGDAGFAAYLPSWFEFGLGIAGVASAGLVFLLLLRVLPFVPGGPESVISGESE